MSYLGRAAAPFFLASLAACGASAPPPTTMEAQPAPRPRAFCDDADGNVASVGVRYERTLSSAEGDRTAAEPRAVVDLTIDDLVACYGASHEAPATQLAIVSLLGQMRDVRALPVLLDALAWRAELTEEATDEAARSLRVLPLDDEQRGQAIEALAAALGRITGMRGIDNRMRIDLLRTLGELGDRRATPALSTVVLARTEEQDFLINRLACEQLGRLRDPASIPTLIQALYLYGTNNPAMRMNDVAAIALVGIGRPSLAPLIETLAGNDADANRIAAEYIEAVRQRDAEAAATMSVDTIVVGEASYTLGQLGLPEAIDPLLAELSQLDQGERPTSIETDPRDLGHMGAAALALVSINRDDAATARIRDALIATYRRTDPEMHPGFVGRAQLLVAFQHLNDPGMLPFFLEQARRPRRGEEDVNVRVLAYRAYTMLANADEARALTTLLAREPEGDVRDGMLEYQPMLDAAVACDEDVACWTTRLQGDDAGQARKAAYMLARYGRGQPAVIAVLVAALGSDDEEVRGEVAYALDFAAPEGSAEGVARIDSLREEDQGRAIWSHVESLFLVIQARLRIRAEG